MHPFLLNRSSVLLYIVLWILIGAASSFFFAQGTAIPIFCTAYAGLGGLSLSTWFIVRSIGIRMMRPSMLIGVGVVSSAFIAALWLAGFHALMRWFSDPLLQTSFSSQFPTIGFTGGILTLLVFAIHLLLLSAQEQRTQREESIQLKVLAREAELRALRSQIDPHFLFNSLNSISALATTDGNKTREMTIALSEYLRITLQQGSEKMIPLREELGLIQRYLDIEKIRLGSRLRVLMDIAEDATDVLLPPLLIQPLVENALRHGIGSLLEGGTIFIKAEVRHLFLVMEIDNPFDDAETPAHSSGMGQQNVRQRLAVAYQNEAEMTISQTDERYTVRLRIPCELSVQKSLV